MTSQQSTGLVLLPVILLHRIHGIKIHGNLSPRQNNGKVGQYSKEHNEKQIHFKSNREARPEMKFYFAIIGDCDTQDKALLIQWLEDMVKDYNERSGSPLDNFHILVGE